MDKHWTGTGCVLGYNGDLHECLLSLAFHTNPSPLHHVIGFKDTSPQSNFKAVFESALTSVWFPCDPNSLPSSRPSCAAYSLLPAQRPSAELSDEVGRVSSQSSARGAVTDSFKKDRNVQKTRTRTLTGVKGSVLGAVPNEEEIVIPDGSFSPLNRDPLGGGPASPSDSEWGPYLHLTSLIIFLPHHHHHHPSFLKCSV
jgi:hypothetical protein